jgi:hypothetical protein
MAEQTIEIIRPSTTDAITTFAPVNTLTDAFGRVRVSDPTNLFSVQTQYNAESLQMETGSTGTGSSSWSANSRMTSLTATAGTGTAFTQSYQYIPYQPGKSQLIKITGVMGAAVSGVTKDYGYFDSANGIFFRQTSAGVLQMVRRTSTSGSIVNNAVNQSDWSEDTLDGNGTSGITLDATKAFILVIDLQFLGMGKVRIGFNIDGAVYWAHHFRNANNLDVPYMQTATLPIQALLTASSSSGAATMYFKCAAVESEGGFNVDKGLSFSTAEGTVTAASGADTHILSLRPLTTFNSIANRILILLNEINVVVTGANPIQWKLCIGSTFSVDPTYANVNSTYSGCENGTGGTLTSAGTVISTGYVAATSQSKQLIAQNVNLRYPITLDRAGAVRALGTLSLIVNGIGGNSATRATFNITEIR